MTTTQRPWAAPTRLLVTAACIKRRRALVDASRGSRAKARSASSHALLHILTPGADLREEIDATTERMWFHWKTWTVD